MVSKNIWKKVWLFFGIIFIFISIFMIFFGPLLASITGTAPFSDRARAMISFLWIWMFIYNGIGNFFLYRDIEKNKVLLILGIPAGLAFTILQSIYMVIGYFEIVLSEVIWAILPLIWSIIIIIYFLDQKKK
ncbi:MAG: hypothetical protein KAX33_11510 [Candidatus Lokiarchaeota archaeon]|nr:hypothetical protein [Candidatus Lokiarchaeota archaeon]